MWKLRLSVVLACGAFGLTGAAGALADPGGQPNSNANPNAGGSSNANANSNAGGNSSSNGSSNAGGSSSSQSSSNAGGNSGTKGKSGSHKGSHGKSNHTGPGDSNAGDVWLDNVGQPAGPGHEMDPHLACQDINLWGDKLADSSGTYTINGWPPSGSKEVDYSSTWSYDTSKGGDQVVSVIDVQKLIATAAANGDSPAKQGYHFKLDFSQDPQKHKVFWIDCPAPSSSSTTSSSSGTTQSSTTQTTAPSTTSSSTPSGSVKAAHHRRHRHRRSVKAHSLRRPHRRHRAPHRSVKAVSVAAPAFTG